MLVLGIDTATAQVGCAIGGHEGVLASAHSSRETSQRSALPLLFAARRADASPRTSGNQHEYGEMPERPKGLPC